MRDNSKLLIGSRESGSVNRELGSCSLCGYMLTMFQKCKSGIRSEFPVPFLTIIGFITVCVLSITSACKAFEDT